MYFTSAVAAKREKIAEQQKITNEKTAEIKAWATALIAQKEITKEAEKTKDVENIEKLDRLKQIELDKKKEQEEQQTRKKGWTDFHLRIKESKMSALNFSQDIEHEKNKAKKKMALEEVNRQLQTKKFKKKIKDLNSKQSLKSEATKEIKIKQLNLREKTAIEFIEKLYANKKFTKQSRQKFRTLLGLYGQGDPETSARSSSRISLSSNLCTLFKNISEGNIDGAINIINKFHKSSLFFFLSDFTLNDFLSGSLSLKETGEEEAVRTGSVIGYAISKNENYKPKIEMRAPKISTSIKWQYIIRTIIENNPCFKFLEQMQDVLPDPIKVAAVAKPNPKKKENPEQKTKTRRLKPHASIEQIKKLYKNKTFSKQSRRNLRYLLEQLYNKVLSPKKEESGIQKPLIKKFCDILKKIYDDKINEAINIINTFHKSSLVGFLSDFTLDDFLMRGITVKGSWLPGHTRLIMPWTHIVQKIVVNNNYNDTCFDFLANTNPPAIIKI